MLRVGTLLGENPIGWTVQFLDAPTDVIAAEILRFPGRTRSGMRPVGPLPEALNALMPFEAGWTRELIMPCGRWTAYLNNFIGGGDPTAIGGGLGLRLGVTCVVAIHAPRHGPGHQSTQFWVNGPGGVPPSMSIRNIAADAADGRWSWHERGTPFPFEETDRYAARLKRERFDGPMLLRYLRALGIPADDDAAYGPGVLFQQEVDYTPRQQTLAELRALVH